MLLGRERSRPAWSQRIGPGKLQRSQAVLVMTCRSCWELGWGPGANTPMTIMRAPQHGHGYGSTGGGWGATTGGFWGVAGREGGNGEGMGGRSAIGATCLADE